MSYAITFATLNPAAKGAGVTLSEGNLKATFAASTAGHVRSLYAVPSGRSYYEAAIVAAEGGVGVAGMRVGFCRTTHSLSAATFGEDATGFGVDSNGSIYCAGLQVGAIPAMSVGDTIGLLLDTNERSVSLYVNGVYDGVKIINAVLNSLALYPAIGFSGVPSTALEVRAYFGATPFLAPSLPNALPGSGDVTYTPEPDSPDRFVFRSTDFGAPALPDQPGGLISVLKAVLVDGYGEKAPAGWSRPFSSGATTAVFQQGAGAGDRCYRVYDNTLDASSCRLAHIRGYESMSAVSTGANPFPTAAQVGGNGCALGYFQQDGTSFSRAWVVVADAHSAHVLIQRFPSAWEYAYFGKFLSEVPADTFNNMVYAGTQSSSGPGAALAYYNTGYDELYLERNALGAVGAVRGVLGPSAPESMTVMPAAICQEVDHFEFPEKGTNKLRQAQPWILSDNGIRGRIPGLWSAQHKPSALGGSGTTWAGDASGPLSGKKFELFGPLAVGAGLNSHAAIETSGGWT